MNIRIRIRINPDSNPGSDFNLGGVCALVNNYNCNYRIIVDIDGRQPKQYLVDCHAPDCQELTQCGEVCV